MYFLILDPIVKVSRNSQENYVTLIKIYMHATLKFLFEKCYISLHFMLKNHISDIFLTIKNI